VTVSDVAAIDRIEHELATEKEPAPNVPHYVVTGGNRRELGEPTGLNRRSARCAERVAVQTEHEEVIVRGRAISFTSAAKSQSIHLT
jgi:hypothetical protein